jgi:hypothetical protein
MLRTCATVSGANRFFKQFFNIILPAQESGEPYPVT